MVEVREIEKREIPPEDICIVIEKAGGRFVANGFNPGKRSGSFYAPPAFKTLKAAISASVEWATRNNVPIVYLKGVRNNASGDD
jgi:hypothetical protein